MHRTTCKLLSASLITCALATACQKEAPVLDEDEDDAIQVDASAPKSRKDAGTGKVPPGNTPPKNDLPKPDAGGAPPATGGMAVVKFCNPLVLEGGMSLSLSLFIGDPPLRLSAKSGECVPAVPEPCPSIPSGALPVALVNDDDGEALAQGRLNITGGLEYVFLAAVNPMTGEPSVTGGQFKPEYKCSTSNPLMRADGGAPMTMDAGMPSMDAGAPDAAQVKDARPPDMKRR